MKNLRDDAKSFRPVFQNAVHRSTIRKTSREKDAKDLALRFEKQTDGMLNRFKSTKKADSELSLVSSTAQQLDDLIHSVNLGPQVGSRWDKIQTELGQVSAAFGLQPSNGNTANIDGPACIQAVGPERSKRLVSDCLAVSPATHPPCNAQNSCRLIIDEIRRSCSLLDARSAPALCRDYQ